MRRRTVNAIFDNHLLFFSSQNISIFDINQWDEINKKKIRFAHV